MDKKIIVIDTSVVVKWFVNESGSEKAREILKNLNEQKIKIIFPKIIFLEAINALQFGGGKLKKDELRDVLNLLAALPNVEFVEINNEILLQTIDISFDFKIAAYDSVFIAFAKRNNCVLLTADRKHHRKDIYSKIEYL